MIKNVIDYWISRVISRFVQRFYRKSRKDSHLNVRENRYRARGTCKIQKRIIFGKRPCDKNYTMNDVYLLSSSIILYPLLENEHLSLSESKFVLRKYIQFQNIYICIFFNVLIEYYGYYSKVLIKFTLVEITVILADEWCLTARIAVTPILRRQ